MAGAPIRNFDMYWSEGHLKLLWKVVSSIYPTLDPYLQSRFDLWDLVILGWWKALRYKKESELRGQGQNIRREILKNIYHEKYKLDITYVSIEDYIRKEVYAKCDVLPSYYIRRRLQFETNPLLILEAVDTMMACRRELNELVWERSLKLLSGYTTRDLADKEGKTTEAFRHSWVLFKRCFTDIRELEENDEY